MNLVIKSRLNEFHLVAFKPVVERVKQRRHYSCLTKAFPKREAFFVFKSMIRVPNKENDHKEERLQGIRDIILIL